MLHSIPLGILSFSSGGYQVDNSIMLDRGSNQFLNLTPSSAGNRDIWTLSFWVKRNTFGTDQFLFSAGADANNFTGLSFTTSNTLRYEHQDSGSRTDEIIPNMLFRDPHAWYHIVCAVDTTSGTEAQRVRLYINGVEESLSGTPNYPGQNVDTDVNQADEHRFGSRVTDGADDADVYLSEVVFVDGTQKQATDFGEYDSNAVWRPVDVSGLTFGTNGFYLNFASSGSNLGDDASGNSNDFTNNNSAAQSNDSPTKNFCVLTPLIVGNGTANFSEGNLKVVQSGGGNLNTFGSIGLSSGKWHYEVTLTNTVDQFGLGIIPVGNVTGNTNQFFNNGIGAMISGGGDGNVYNNGSRVATITGGSGTDGQTFSCEIDLDNDQLEWFNNAGSSLGTYSFTQATANGGRYFPCIHCNDDATYVANFGASTFSKTPSSGFTGISAALLLEQITPTIEDGTAYFQPTTYQGNGTAIGSGGKEVNQSGNSSFTPDFVWIKNRDQGDSHMLYDSVRGATEDLHSDTRDMPNTDTEGLSTFDDNGFTVGSNVAVNTSSEDYIGWQWIAGGAPTADNTAGAGATPTAGSVKIDGSNLGSALAGSQAAKRLSANTKSGFSVVKYTGTGSNLTVAHGLGLSPDLVIVKRLSGATAYDWNVFHTSAGAANYVLLNQDHNQASNSNRWQDTAPSSTVVSIGTSSDLNAASTDFIMLCFATVAGYSAFGSYTGNNSSNGPFISLDFTPSFFIQKRIDATGHNWHVYDTTRKTYNYNDTRLFPNLASQEYSNGEGILDILSNGVKIRDDETWFNASGGTFIYMAFADHPFAGTTPATAR